MEKFLDSICDKCNYCKIDPKCSGCEKCVQCTSRSQVGIVKKFLILDFQSCREAADSARLARTCLHARSDVGKAAESVRALPAVKIFEDKHFMR